MTRDFLETGTRVRGREVARRRRTHRGGTTDLTDTRDERRVPREWGWEGSVVVGALGVAEVVLPRRLRGRLAFGVTPPLARVPSPEGPVRRPRRALPPSCQSLRLTPRPLAQTLFPRPSLPYRTQPNTGAPSGIRTLALDSTPRSRLTTSRPYSEPPPRLRTPGSVRTRRSPVPFLPCPNQVSKLDLCSRIF